MFGLSLNLSCSRVAVLGLALGVSPAALAQEAQVAPPVGDHAVTGILPGGPGTTGLSVSHSLVGLGSVASGASASGRKQPASIASRMYPT